MDTLIKDIRFGIRVLTKNRGFTLVALMTLALGIGANTAIFTVVNAIVFRPLPFNAPQQLVGIWTKNLQRPGSQYPASLPAFRDWQQQSHALSGLAAYAFNRFHVSGKEGVDETRGALATTNFFDVMGVAPVLGRALRPSDERERVVVLSDEIWRRRFNSDRNVLGKTMDLNAETFTVIGVMPPLFRFPSPDIEVWTSLAAIYSQPVTASTGDWVNSRDLHGYRIVGRLQNGTTVEQAQAEMNTIAERLAQTYPDSEGGTGVVLVPLRTQMVGDYQKPLVVMLIAVGFILLIACANVANLMMARTSARDREIAIRRAMGAGQIRLIRQMLTESILLGTVGGALGLLLATWGVQLLLTLTPKDIPRLEGVTVDRWTMLFTFAVSIGTGILFGLAPAWHARRLSLNETLREGGRGLTGQARVKRVRGLLVMSEIALAVMLLVGAGLMLKSFQRLTDISPGFNSENLLTMSLGLQFVRYQDPARQVAFFENALERVRALPGVVAAGAATSLPPTYIQQSTGFTIEGKPVEAGKPASTALYIPATYGFIEALGLPILRGRALAARDTASAAGVVVINQTFANSFFNNEDPVGRRITLNGVPRTIVGVVGDARYQGLGVEAGPQAYVPHAQSPFPGMRIIVRTTTDPNSLISAVRTQIESVDREEGPTRFATMTKLLSESVAQPRFNTLLIGLFAGLAFVLSAIGIYGVINYDVTQRTGEIGVRMALGAQAGDVLRLILKQGLMLIFGGLLAGIGGAFALTRFLSGLLFGVTPTDAATFVTVSIALTIVALLACYIPARRATKVDPLIALRSE
ncbi:MAG TPA: ABC transporter permease [Pyrinomonadaceae bacterium]|jgi:putative ABC transport system permease protein|nr:ABC transporter permease [Pyrinomonadaceae bacterium]